MSIPEFPKPVLSPCTGVCALDVEGYCEGCRRTGEEIARWMAMSEQERAWLMNRVLPHRTCDGLQK